MALHAETGGRAPVRNPPALPDTRAASTPLMLRGCYHVRHRNGRALSHCGCWPPAVRLVAIPRRDVTPRGQVGDRLWPGRASDWLQRCRAQLATECYGLSTN
jgi:hypothetical protein